MQDMFPSESSLITMQQYGREAGEDHPGQSALRDDLLHGLAHLYKVELFLAYLCMYVKFFINQIRTQISPKVSTKIDCRVIYTGPSTG